MLFFEVDPLVEQIARDKRFFSYLTDAEGRGAVIDVRIGDGRQSVALLPERSIDLLFIDAFSSDSIPTHLLTLEALKVFRARLREGGAIAYHISNLYFELTPPLITIGRAQGLIALRRQVAALEPGAAPSTWLVLMDRETTAGALSPPWATATVSSLSPQRRLLVGRGPSTGWIAVTSDEGDLWRDDFVPLVKSLRSWKSQLF